MLLELPRSFDPKAGTRRDASTPVFIGVTCDVGGMLIDDFRRASRGEEALDDALGRRVGKTVDGITTLYLPAGAQTVVELTRAALPSSQAAIDGDEGDGTLANMAQAPASGGFLSGSNIARVNFQPATTVVPVGFVKDAGRAQAVRTNSLTYGWSADVRDQAVVRHGSDAQHRVQRVIQSSRQIGVGPYPKWARAICALASQSSYRRTVVAHREQPGAC